MEKSLLSDPDRTHDCPDHGSMGKTVGKSAHEQGAEAPKAVRILERGTVERIYGKRKGPDQI